MIGVQLGGLLSDVGGSCGRVHHGVRANCHDSPTPESFSREKASAGLTNGCGSVVMEISL